MSNIVHVKAHIRRKPKKKMTRCLICKHKLYPPSKKYKNRFPICLIHGTISQQKQQIS